MAEWLRRLTRNQLGSARAGSNPADCENLLHDVGYYLWSRQLYILGVTTPNHVSKSVMKWFHYTEYIIVIMTIVRVSHYILVVGVCGFEQSDLCGYTQDKTDDFDWTRTQKATQSSGTGPATDHTYKSGLGKTTS